MNEIELAKLEGARAILKRLAREADNQKQPGISVVLVKHLAQIEDEGLATLLAEGAADDV